MFLGCDFTHPSVHSVITNRCAVAAAGTFSKHEKSLSGNSHCYFPALYFYDMCLTFSDSVDLIWRHRISGASLLYIVNRYLMVPYLILEMIALNWTDCKVGASSCL